ncbi:MAG: chromophore lyase CpcT/CpeT [Flavobacteriales bacterium]|nr:chromophore lyase CpcT/CpeT [Flavobacteriales bacterium]
MRTRILSIVSGFMCVLFVHAQETKPSLELLKRYMVGSYSSSAQAARDTNYYNIELEMARIWLKETDGIWLYVEQATAKKKDKPYRQRIYHLTQLDDSTFSSSVCNLDSMHLFTGAYKDIARLGAMKPIDAKPLEGCALILHWRNGRFVGSTHESDCKNAWGKATYATSEVNIGPDGLLSWDRGYDDTHTQVWGAELGGYEFVKVKVEPAAK